MREKKPPRTKPCLVCGVLFEKPPTLPLAKWEVRKYCSSKCYGQTKIGQPSTGVPFAKGLTPWNKGVEGYMAGEANVNWKGNDVGYAGVHAWMKKNYPKTGSCEICGGCDRNGKTSWANLSGHYRRDRDDWMEMCSSCHHKRDRQVRREGMRCNSCGSSDIHIPETRAWRNDYDRDNS